MAKSKRSKVAKKPDIETIMTRAYPQNIKDHLTELEQEFSAVTENIKENRDYSIRWCKASKTLIRTGIENAIDTFLSNGAMAPLSTKKGKATLSSLALTNIGSKLSDEILLSVSEASFRALHRSFQTLVHKIQAPHSVRSPRIQHPKDSPVATEPKQDADDSLSTQVARLSVGAQVARLSADIKEESKHEPTAIPPPDSTVFTISLAVPGTVSDHRFAMTFKDERVVEGLARISTREIWHLVCDAVNQDPDIPSRPPMLPWITDVKQLDDKCLEFTTKTEEDLHAVTTNVKWARGVRDTISAGLKTYKVLLKKVRIRKKNTELHISAPSMIGKLRKENSTSIPFLNDIDAVRDAMMLQDPASRREHDDHADYVLVFGSRDAANAALDKGLVYHQKKRMCLAHSPGAQWHKQCSKCQKHNHISQNCESDPTCGRCAHKHSTQYCTCGTVKCANCQGGHYASSKTCPVWLEAEKKAHRAYRFPAEDSELRAPTATKEPAKPQNHVKRQPSFTQTVRKLSPRPAPINPDHKAASNTDTDARPATPSVLLQTIDEFRAFVAAREGQRKPNPKKRKAELKGAEYMMAGALQTEENKQKRIKREEEERPVWPIGQKDYAAPSLRGRKSEDQVCVGRVLRLL